MEELYDHPKEDYTKALCLRRSEHMTNQLKRNYWPTHGTKAEPFTVTTIHPGGRACRTARPCGR